MEYAIRLKGRSGNYLVFERGFGEFIQTYIQYFCQKLTPLNIR